MFGAPTPAFQSPTSAMPYPGTPPAPRLFLVTTPGLSATRWLSFVLASRGDVFVAHGRHPLRSIIHGDITREKSLGDEESLTLGVQTDDFYNKNSLKDIFRAYVRIMPGARAYGNVHTFTMASLAQKASQKGSLAELHVANVLRHPISYIESHRHLVHSAWDQNMELYRSYEAMFRRAMNGQPFLKSLKHVDLRELVAFAVSCQSVADRNFEFQFEGLHHFKMEELTANPGILENFCVGLTSLPYSQEKLNEFLGTGPINRHSKNRKKRTPIEVFESWEPWKKEVARRLIPADLVTKIEAQGYDLSMLRNADPAAGPLPTPSIQEEEAASLTVQLIDPQPDPVPKAPETDPDDPGRLLAAGNYVAAARGGNPDRWETYAGLGLIGRTTEALEGLKRFDLPEARLYEAIALFIAGDDEQAARTLEGIDLEYARNLLGLIRKPRINVLAMLPWVRTGSSDFLSGLDPNGRFNVKNISFHPSDLGHEPEADVRKYVDPLNPPDFFVAKNVEWHLVPPNLQDLPCPVIGHTADFDLHIQALYPWLGLFDEIVVNDPTEWEDAKGLVKVPAVTCPKAFGVAENLPPIPTGPRDIDVFQSGFVLHPYHPDKAAPCLEMLRLDPAKKVWFYDGFSSADTYTGLLGRSKACYTFVRHSGAMPTRGLEALSMGTAVVVQKGGNLGLYFGEDEGVLEYGPEPGSLEAALGRIADNWPDFQKRAYKGALKVRRDFRLPLVADQYFRFLTVLAARPRGPRQKADRSGLYQKRMVMARGWLPGGPQLLHALMRDRLDRLEKRLNQEPSSRLFIDLTRELVLDYAGTLAHIRDFEPGYPPPVHQLLDLALNLFTSGVNQFPRSLPLRFNLIRTVLHLGRPDMVTNALAFARQTLEAPFHHWAVDVLEDVFPWDCYSGFFNYRKYFDRVTFHLSRGVQVGPDLTRLILASLHHYLSFYANPVEHASKAVSLDRDFAPYRLRLARIMIERAGVVDQKRAKGVENHVVLNTGKTVDDMLMAERLLHELARDSILFPEAADLLEQLASENRTTQPISDSIRLAAARYRASVDDIQRSGLRLRKADWRDGSQPGPAASLDQVEYRHRLAVKAGEGEG